MPDYPTLRILYSTMQCTYIMCHERSDRKSFFQALLTARQEKEIQLKMLMTRGESVQRNTSAEGVTLVQKQIEDVRDSWDGLLSACIQCKRSELPQISVYEPISAFDVTLRAFLSSKYQCSQWCSRIESRGRSCHVIGPLEGQTNFFTREIKHTGINKS